MRSKNKDIVLKYDAPGQVRHGWSDSKSIQKDVVFLYCRNAMFKNLSISLDVWKKRSITRKELFIKNSKTCFCSDFPKCRLSKLVIMLVGFSTPGLNHILTSLNHYRILHRGHPCSSLHASISFLQPCCKTCLRHGNQESLPAVEKCTEAKQCCTADRS